MYSNPCNEQWAANNRFDMLKPVQLNGKEKQAVVTLALAILQEQHQPGDSLPGTEATQNYLRLRLADEKAEVFGCLFLDSKHRVLAIKELFYGTIDGAAVYPRIIVQHALSVNAAAMILYHNHPSGVAEASDADRVITRRVREALALIDVRTLDHIIVTCNESQSMAELGLI